MIKVTFAALETAESDVRSTASRLNGKLDDLAQTLAPVVATWEGEAAVRYLAKQRQWDTAAADLNAVLAQIGVALRQAHEEYRRTEGINVSRWQ